MSIEFPLVVVHPVDSDIRLIQLAPGVDASIEPLLSHAGLACELGCRVEVAMNGISGASDCIRQFLTTESNNLDYELLVLLAEEFNDPAGRARRTDTMQERLRLAREQTEPTPDWSADVSHSPEP